MRLEKYDEGLMYCALHHGEPADKGFIHRQTGEIVFVADSEEEARLCAGDHAVPEYVFNRAAVEASPDQWLEIPKHDGPQSEEDEFIDNFLRENGLK